MIRFSHHFSGIRTVKGLIEELGVPHAEIDVILVNGHSVGFCIRVEDGDDISVYPVFESLDVSPLVRLRPEPLREIRFVADVHLGRLASYLRLVGFDTFFDPGTPDTELVAISRCEHRILLTRDRELLKRRALSHAVYVRATGPRAQIKEVIQRLDLRRKIRPFSRCLRCNELPDEVEKEEIAQHIPPGVAAIRNRFHKCRSCGRVYWPGMHYSRMQQFLAELRLDKPGS